MIPIYLGKHRRYFRGKIYRRDPSSKWSSLRRYFKPKMAHIRNGTRALHVEVWKAKHGPIPAGHQVHHIDKNTDRNRLKYLELLPIAQHQAHHAPTDMVARRAHLDRIRPRVGNRFHKKATATRARRRRYRRAA